MSKLVGLLFVLLAVVHSGMSQCRSCSRYSSPSYSSSTYEDTSPVQYTVRGGDCSRSGGGGGCGGGGSSSVRYYSTPVEVPAPVQTRTVYREYDTTGSTSSGCSSRAGGCSSANNVRYYSQPATESRSTVYYSQPSVEYVQSAPRVSYYQESAPVVQSYRYVSSPVQQTSRTYYQESPVSYTRSSGGCGGYARC